MGGAIGLSSRRDFSTTSVESPVNKTVTTTDACAPERGSVYSRRRTNPKGEDDMRGVERRRRGTAAVSPVGLLGSERAGVYCLTQANGYEVWYARGADGCIVRTIDVGPGDDAWPAIVALHALVYRDDDIESWARRVIGIGPVSDHSPFSSPAPSLVPPESARPARARTSEGARRVLTLA